MYICSLKRFIMGTSEILLLSFIIVCILGYVALKSIIKSLRK